MLDGFEWDPAKARSNYGKHGVSFEEAASVFFDTRGVTAHDPDHSATEDRFITIGLSLRGRLLTVVHAERHSRIRIIMARRATTEETLTYAKD